MVIRRIGAFSLAKIMGVLYGGIGLLFGILAAAFMLLGGGAMLATGMEGAEFGAGAMMATGLLVAIGVPLFYGFIGFFAGLLSAWLFNVAAGFAGGLEIETQ